jgi:hypothetical protein
MPFAQIQRNPVAQLKMSLLFGDVLGRLTHFRWNPTRKRDRANSVGPRRGVLPLQSSESLLVQRTSQANYRWPESAMNVGNLSTHQTAHENFIAIAYGASCPEDCAPLFVPQGSPKSGQ